MSKAKLMLGNAVEISLIFRRNLGPLVLGWAPNHFVLGAQLAPDKKRLVCIPAGCFAIIVLQKYCYYKFSVALPQGALGWSAVCDCGISHRTVSRFGYVFPRLHV